MVTFFGCIDPDNRRGAYASRALREVGSLYVQIDILRSRGYCRRVTKGKLMQNTKHFLDTSIESAGCGYVVTCCMPPLLW